MDIHVIASICFVNVDQCLLDLRLCRDQLFHNSNLLLVQLLAYFGYIFYWIENDLSQMFYAMALINIHNLVYQ